MQQAYRAAQARADGRVLATWEVVYATCFRGDAPAPTPGGGDGVPGDAAYDARREVVVDVARIGRRARDAGQGNPE